MIAEVATAPRLTRPLTHSSETVSSRRGHRTFRSAGTAGASGRFCLQIRPWSRIVAGVDLPALMIGLADDAPPSGEPVVARAGVRTRSTLAIGLGAAETAGTRRGVAKTVARALLGRAPRAPAREVLTPVLEDPPSLVPFVVALAPVLARPAAVRRMAARTVADYSITPEAVTRVSAR